MSGDQGPRLTPHLLLSLRELGGCAGERRVGATAVLFKVAQPLQLSRRFLHSVASALPRGIVPSLTERASSSARWSAALRPA